MVCTYNNITLPEDAKNINIGNASKEQAATETSDYVSQKATKRLPVANQLTMTPTNQLTNNVVAHSSSTVLNPSHFVLTPSLQTSPNNGLHTAADSTPMPLIPTITPDTHTPNTPCVTLPSVCMMFVHHNGPDPGGGNNNVTSQLHETHYENELEIYRSREALISEVVVPIECTERE